MRDVEDVPGKGIVDRADTLVRIDEAPTILLHPVFGELRHVRKIGERHPAAAKLIAQESAGTKVSAGAARRTDVPLGLHAEDRAIPQEGTGCVNGRGEMVLPTGQQAGSIVLVHRVEGFPDGSKIFEADESSHSVLLSGS